MISFTSVTKQYGSSATLAVNNVSLTINKGEHFALLGPNGAGKTTLVKMLLDFTRPTSGAIAIDGVLCKEPLSRTGVGYLPENIRIPHYLSGRDFLVRQAVLCGMGKDEYGKKIADIVKLVGMEGSFRAKVKTFSKGMLQRIGLASAILTGTKVLVLDEPQSGLDPIGIRDVRHIMEGLRETGVTIILNSHLLSEVEKTCDTAAIINKGSIMRMGKISDFSLANETLEDVFIKIVGGANA
jgi:ABC-2 type transport system ATP-binding protein